MQGFADWAKRHCTVFGLDGKALDMVASWQPLFDAAGYTAAELSAATDWLATHAPPEFPGQHLGALQRHVRAARAVDVKARQEEEFPACVLCGGQGMLSVPDVRGVRDGTWVGLDVGAGPCFYTHAVKCSCRRGRFLNCTNRKGEPLIDLATYEAVNPGWRPQLAQRERELRALAGVGTDDLTTALDAKLAELRGRQRQPGEDEE